MKKTDILKKTYEMYKNMFDKSSQAIYIFLDDQHKICNSKFLTLLGYKNAEEWAKVENSFTEAFVDEDSQHALVHAYQNAMENLVGSAIKVKWKTASNKKVETNVILVPIIVEGYLMALHFISEK
jgi:hypothetical protein